MHVFLVLLVVLLKFDYVHNATKGIVFILPKNVEKPFAIIRMEGIKRHNQIFLAFDHAFTGDFFLLINANLYCKLNETSKEDIPANVSNYFSVIRWFSLFIHYQFVDQLFQRWVFEWRKNVNWEYAGKYTFKRIYRKPESIKANSFLCAPTALNQHHAHSICNTSTTPFFNVIDVSWAIYLLYFLSMFLNINHLMNNNCKRLGNISAFATTRTPCI